MEEHHEQAQTERSKAGQGSMVAGEQFCPSGYWNRALTCWHERMLKKSEGVRGGACSGQRHSGHQGNAGEGVLIKSKKIKKWNPNDNKLKKSAIIFT